MRREAAVLAERSGDRWNLGLARTALGIAFLRRGDPGQAAASLHSAVAPLHELGDRWVLSRTLEGLAAVAAERGDDRRAARLSGAAEAMRLEIGAPPIAILLPDHAERVARLRSRLGDDRFGSAWADGRAMAYEEAVAYALAEQPPV